ncbi:VOC family protein [Flavobacterium sp. 3HN19-14]|uniref:VOC family protein n=1 Tax=Flavobacterium sp. 3HN19-14 TaxID=3448133 RepID=UPI003EE369B1
MAQEIWLNLPVKNVEKSKNFFKALGYEFNSPNDNETMAGLKIGESIVMLFEENTLKTFMMNEITDTSKSSELMISIGADSREKVDSFAKNAAAAGGNVFAKPAEIQGWMYGCAFADLDGHRWNALYMDHDKMPK